MMPMWIIGFLFFLFFVIKDPGMFTISLKSFLIITFLLPAVLYLRCFIYYNIFGVEITAVDLVLSLPLWIPFTVWWEDMVFAAPIVYALRKGYPKWLWIPSMVSLMAVFGMGHAYQGTYAIFITAIMLALFIHLGKKYGMITLVYFHFMYDMSILLLLRHYSA
jgi:hypothetical protein